MAACEEECQTHSLKGFGDQHEVTGTRRAISSGEPSSDGSVDEERSALSDSELPDALRIRTIATQAKGPSSDALEAECRAEQSSHASNGGYETAEESDANEWVDLIGKNQLVYKVLKKCDSVKPRNGQEVTIRVQDKLFGIDSCDKVTFVLGYSMVIEAWELPVATMHEGEIVHVKSNSRFAYGITGDVERDILPNQEMEYEIELLKVGEGITFLDMPRDEFFQYVARLKERGKYYYSRKEFEKAIFVYKRCTDIIEVSRNDQELRDIFSIINSNLAVCYAKLEDWKATLSAATEALKLNEKNTKALFRQANAYTNMGMVDEAFSVLKKALATDPSNMLIARELQRVRTLRLENREKERNLYKRMLAGMHLDESPHDRFAHRFRYVTSIVTVLIVAVLFHFFNASVISFFTSFRQYI